MERSTAGLTADGHALIATFVLDDHHKCNGLLILPYDDTGLIADLGKAYALVQTRAQEHVTPWGELQKFQFRIFRPC